MTISTHHKSPCPCGTGKDYTQCCGRYIEADELPEYPEQLMRSRYTAYAFNNAEYLKKTWHEHTRPAQLQLDTEINWLSLVLRLLYIDGFSDPGSAWPLGTPRREWLVLFKRCNTADKCFPGRPKGAAQMIQCCVVVFENG